MSRLDRTAVREALGVLLLSRLLVWFVAVFSALKLSPAASGNERAYDDPTYTHPFDGWPGDHIWDALLSPLARWDAIFYLGIANDGYVDPDGNGMTEGEEHRNGFFPLYSTLVRVLSPFGDSEALTLIAAYAVSLAAFAVALYLLYRLVDLELGPGPARTTLLLLAFFPASIYFGAPYTESVFLAVTVGAFYCARTDRWALAGVLAAFASATRIPGLLLPIPLLFLYLYGPRGRAAARNVGEWWRPRFRIDRSIAWLGLAPLGIAAFSLHLHARAGDALGWLETVNLGQKRHVGLPFEGAVQAIRAAGAGVIDIAEGAADTFPAQANLVDIAFMGFAIVATIGVFRRLPAAYGVYAATMLALPLSTPVPGEPIGGFPRYASVVFPIFMWLALWSEERRALPRVVAVSGVLLGAFASQFATWQWIA